MHNTKKIEIVMESIFDHNVTERELDYLFVKYKNKDDYLRNTKNYSKYADLYLLYNFRGNGIKAKYYLEKVINSN
ncbi:MAG: hypothetical protein R6W90_17595 [Ignavibacteriaceae bacterium]